jgi:glycosyltransferase involved in cell wall biosynthesis
MHYGVLRSWHLPKAWGLKVMWKRQYLRLFRIYTNLYGTPDLIHAHGYVAGLAARYLTEKTGIPYILTEHSTSLPNDSVPVYHQKDLLQTYRHASALIAVSVFLKDAICTFAGPGADVTVIGNPVDLSRFPLRTRKKPTVPIQILSIGSLEHRKNYALLLRAISLIPNDYNLRLVIIGTGPEQSKLMAIAQQLEIDSIVTFVGHVDEAELVAHLARTDVFVSSSVKENFGVVIIEAMACGIPVIATPSGGPEEYITEVSGKLMADHTPETLAHGIQDVISNLDQYEAQKIRNVASQFSFEVIGPQVSDIYQEISRTI